MSFTVQRDNEVGWCAIGTNFCVTRSYPVPFGKRSEQEKIKSEMMLSTTVPEENSPEASADLLA